MPSLITVLALIGKFSISLTYNGVYIITAELYPTIVRNSTVSICSAFARLGAVIAPNIQLLVVIFNLNNYFGYIL
jgi:MFS transporter, OCT family, solute carrier family 22 (organic cation transporter), member 4/5